MTFLRTLIKYYLLRDLYVTSGAGLYLLLQDTPAPLMTVLILAPFQCRNTYNILQNSDLEKLVLEKKRHQEERQRATNTSCAIYF